MEAAELSNSEDDFYDFGDDDLWEDGVVCCQHKFVLATKNTKTGGASLVWNKTKKYSDKVCSLVDAHSHLHCHPVFRDVLKAGYCCVKKVCLCPSFPDEWKVVSEMVSGPGGSKILPCFGIHPWFAHTVDPDDDRWKAELKYYLGAHTNAIIGEVGIDKFSKARGLGQTFNTHQKKIFEIQFDIASELRRPGLILSLCVLTHCRDWIKRNPDAFFPKVLMHSFSGSVDILKALHSLKRGEKIYYSFSEVINNNENSTKLGEALKIVPENRIMLESDLEDCTQEPEVMYDILLLVSKAKGWTVAHTAAVTTANALEFFSF